MKYMQRLGKALMLPVACLPICGLLMGLGYFLCPAAMQGGEMTGVAAHIGLFLVKAGGALIDHMALLFAIGVGVGLSEKNNGTGAVAALASWLMLTTLLSASTVEAILPAAQKTLLIIPLGIFTFAIFYCTFRLATLKWDFLLSGIEGDIDEEYNEDSIEESNKASKKESNKEKDNSDKYLKKAEGILKGLGGAGNVISVDNCITRLRLEVRDTSLIDEKVIKSAGTSGVIKTGKNSVQVVVGTAVQYVADELERLCEEKTEEVKAPAEGEVIPMGKIPDETFSTGVLGECYGIMPSKGIIYSPLEGTVSVVANTKHAVSFKDGNREVLVHVGIDTVKLGGEGFKVLVSEGDVVKQGQKVMEFDAELIKARGYNPMVVVVEIE